ncbi:MAG: L,D-transpeptidase family protein [Rhizobiales bacterium]|nr:L,D-transpeptidase family protein [Hyphomicrobiales bacterium]
MQSDSEDVNDISNAPVSVSMVPTLGESGLYLMKRSLGRYEEIQMQGGWQRIPQGERLELDVRDPRVAMVRRRLEVTGDFVSDPAADPFLFDQAIYEAVERFQLRHGLKPDGIVGRRTIAAMNIPVEARIRQINLNIKRLMDAMPKSEAYRYVFVNIAGQEVEAVEAGRVVMRKRVIVGKLDRQTPEYDSEVNYIAFNPYWNVPQSIALKDMLPKVQADPGYLVRKNIRVLQGWGQYEREISPYNVNWFEPGVTEKYRLRQDPSSHNSLGTVKINFNNPFAVYLHDTPVKSLFDRSGRNFSSGCVRVQDVRDLVTWLLQDNDGWNRQRVDRTIQSTARLDVPLKVNVPIHLMYLTAWSTDDGVVNFRDDIYNRDTTLSSSLERR